jgi:hypothetical protein
MIRTIQHPLVLVFYNRPKSLDRLLSSIKKYRFKKIYLISDGPKNDKDIKLVNECRKKIKNFNFNCKVHKKFQKENLGLKKNIITGLNWVFKKETTAIILEDDCIPSVEFFIFVSEMLKKFKNDKNISSVCGTNHLSIWKENSNSYIISKNFHSWGWATWANKWKNVNFEVHKLIKQTNKNKMIKYLGSWRAYYYWLLILKKIDNNKIDSWAYLWNYANFLKKKKHIIPSINLISNFGVGKNSTNTKKLPYKYVPSNKINKRKFFPLKFRIKENNSNVFDKNVEDIVYSKSLKNRILWLFKKY